MPREALGIVLPFALAVIATCPACGHGSSTGLGTGAEGGTRPGTDADSSGPGEDSGPINCNSPAPARGAAVPYWEYEAESASTNGTVIGPSRAVNDPTLFNSIAGESSGRMAVELSATGQYVRFTSACAANSIVVRYVIPDSADGSGTSATLGLYIGGVRVQSLSLTSRYAWAYGNPTASDATTNNPSDGYARHFYDEGRLLLPNDLPAGTEVTLQRDASDTAQYYVIDFVDLEEVAAPIGQPANSLSVTTCGATPNDGTDDGVAILNCMNMASAKGQIAWIPEGIFNDAATPLNVNVTVQGAGMWNTTIAGASAFLVCSGPCSVSDLSLYGEVTLRDDANSVHAISGSFGSGSRISNVWMEHFTTGPWIGQVNSPQTTNMVIHGCRVRDLFADGINLNTGTSNTTVEQTNARSTGDDSFASWSTANGCSKNVFQFDTAQLPWRASCFSIYGGSSNAIEDSICADGITYPGIFIDQDFGATPFGGTTSVARDDVLRTGGNMYGKNWGGVTVAGTQMSSPITGVQIENVNVETATFSGVFLVGPNDSIDSLYLDGVTISQPGTYGIAVDPSASGSATGTDVVVTSPGSGGLSNQAASVFTIDRGGGDTGW
jgi:hypothetical protein